MMTNQLLKLVTKEFINPDKIKVGEIWGLINILERRMQPVDFADFLNFLRVQLDNDIQ